MPVFTVTGDIDPFLHVTLQRGEKIICESGAMVMMEDTLDLQGKMSGGFGRALLRSLGSGESFFQQHIEATRGAGDCLLAPLLPGALQILEVGPQRYTLNDGAFVAATDDVQLNTRTQSLGNALFGQSGGFFVLEAGGKGQLVVSGFGSLFMLDVAPGKEVVIDNAHVIAWDSSLHYEISVTTAKSGAGLLGNLLNSVTSGEGVVLRFAGTGKVLISSRNRTAFSAWARGAASAG